MRLLSTLSRIFRHASPWIHSETTTGRTTETYYGFRWSIPFGRRAQNPLPQNPLDSPITPPKKDHHDR